MKVGNQARVKETTDVWKASDEPTITGKIQAAAIVTITMGPHMGKFGIKTEDGKTGWVAVNMLEKI